MVGAEERSENGAEEGAKEGASEIESSGGLVGRGTKSSGTTKSGGMGSPTESKRQIQGQPKVPWQRSAHPETSDIS